MLKPHNRVSWQGEYLTVIRHLSACSSRVIVTTGHVPHLEGASGFYLSMIRDNYFRRDLTRRSAAVAAVLRCASRSYFYNYFVTQYQFLLLPESLYQRTE